MESWSVGFDGDGDVERHAGMTETAAPEQAAMRIRMVSDYICPWCYVGLKRVEQLQAETPVALDVCAYDLRPGTPPEGIPRSEASSRRYPPGYIENLISLAKDAGIDMKRPPLIPNTHKAHEATEFAREYGDLHRVHSALFAAYFEDERNIGDVDVLCDVGASAGLDADGLRKALEGGRYAEEVDRQMEWGRTAGVTGVPTFVFNEKFALSGAQDIDVFRSLAQRIARGALSEED